MPGDRGNITQLLDQWSRGDQEAYPRLMAIAYDDLRAIAHRRLRAGMHDDLATTALVHEVYLRLCRHDGGAWESRAHFYAFASRAMRSILVDHARRLNAKRRGGGVVPLELTEEVVAHTPGASAVDEVLVVDDALGRLAELHPRMAQIVELRFFGGLRVDEVAAALDTSIRTVEREWTRARAYLLSDLRGRDV